MACDAGKPILYVRSILQDLGIDQYEATILHEDNQGALSMVYTGQPTKRTRHMDIKNFALQQWVEQDLLILKRVVTVDNESNLLTKNLPRTLLYQHIEYIMGKVVQAYVFISISKDIIPCATNDKAF